jgi:hypothetical protein
VRILTSLFGAHRWFDANVDAFADGELRQSDHVRFEAHLAACDRCARALALARGTRSLLRALPEMPVTRSFALTDAMVRAPARPAPRRASGIIGPIRAVQGVGAAAVALFAVLVVADLGGAGSPASMSAPQADEVHYDSGDNDADSAQPASGTLEDSGDTGGQRGGGDDSSGEPGGDDGQVEGAGVNPPGPLPTPAPGGVAEISPADDLHDPSRRVTGDTGEAFTTVALESGDDDEFNWLRVAQFASAGLAVAAAAMYAGLRFGGRAR